MTDIAAANTIEVNDAVFCSHFKEVCDNCGYDGREENDSFFGLDPIDREPLDVPEITQNKEGVWLCKKHGSAGCGQCFAWKKKINRARVAAKKANK